MAFGPTVGESPLLALFLVMVGVFLGAWLLLADLWTGTGCTWILLSFLGLPCLLVFVVLDTGLTLMITGMPGSGWAIFIMLTGGMVQHWLS